MSKVVVIGATGHIGTYLIPRLVAARHEVVTVSRGAAKPYCASRAWDCRRTDHLGPRRARSRGPVRRSDPRDRTGHRCRHDLLHASSVRQLHAALAGHISHYLCIGTIWTYGHSKIVPTPEHAPKAPFGDYGIQKAAMEAFLLDQARRTGFPATIVHPGHIVGPGWTPLNPAGHFNTAVFSTLARGERLTLPNFGLETVHHVHADDVAGLIMAAIENWRASTGESFNAVSGAALTLRGFAEGMAEWFGRRADLAFEPFEVWGRGRARPTGPRPGNISPGARTARWRRLGGCSGSSQDTRRSRPSRRRYPLSSEARGALIAPRRFIVCAMASL